MSAESDVVSNSPILQEYAMLKAEQISRIALRDHLLYANLTVVGAVTYFAFSGHGVVHSLLVVPWASFILGWMYLSNDKKVSDIRDYILNELSSRWTALHVEERPFQWESVHRAGPSRKGHKVLQLAVDLITFVLSGFAAMCAYFLSIPAWLWWQYAAFTIALVIMIILTKEFLGAFRKESRDQKPGQTAASLV